MFVKSKTARPSVYSDVGQDQIVTQAENMLATLTGSGAMVGAGSTGSTPIAADATASTSSSKTWLLVGGAALVAFMLLKKRR
jgi:hypothetical protein